MSTKQTTSTDAKSKKRTVTLAELKNISVIIPPGTLPPGISIAIVASSTGTQTGWIEDRDRPSLLPLDELQRLFSIDKMIRSHDTLDNKSFQGTSVALAMVRASDGAPSMGPASAANVATALGLGEILKLNRRALMRNAANDELSLITKDLLVQAVSTTAKTLADYIRHESNSGGQKKTIKEFCFENALPYWLFARLTQKDWIPDEPHVGLTRLLFPKNLGKSITLRVEEWICEPIINSLQPIMKWSCFEETIMANLPLIFDFRLTALEQAKLFQVQIPLGSPYSVRDNLLNSRTAPPPPAEGLFSELKQLCARKMQSQVGLRNRAFNTKVWWNLITGKVIDIDRNGEPVREQVISALEGEENILIDQINFDTVKSKDFKAAVLGIPPDDITWAIFDHFKPPAQLNRIQTPVATEVDISILAAADRSTEDKLIATEKEKELLKTDLFILPDTKEKVRRFPTGGRATLRATQALKALERSKYKSAGVNLRGLLTSFSDDKLTDHAANKIFSELFRLEQEGVLFNTADVAEGINAEVDFAPLEEDEKEDSGDFF